jgi:hypothetical protein
MAAREDRSPAGRGAGTTKPEGRSTSPRRPGADRGTGKAAPGRGENRPAPSLVIASFLGRDSEWVDRETGEIRPAPVSVGGIVYPDGGGELFGIVAGSRGGRSGAGELEEWRQHEREVRELGQERADELAAERKEGRAARSATECARRAKSRSDVCAAGMACE